MDAGSRDEEEPSRSKYRGRRQRARQNGCRLERTALMRHGGDVDTVINRGRCGDLFINRCTAGFICHLRACKLRFGQELVKQQAVHLLTQPQAEWNRCYCGFFFGQLGHRGIVLVRIAGG